jgi:hypothetical protein
MTMIPITRPRQRPPRAILYPRVRGRCQHAEKVGVELMATKNRSRNAPKPVCLVADLRRKRAPRGSFNKLMRSAKFTRSPSTLSSFS